MATVAFPLLVVVLLAVVGSLFGGLVSMGVGGTFDDQNSERLMFARVGFQALAVALLLFMLVFAR